MSFCPPQFNRNTAASSQREGVPPPSPPRMGFVSGATPGKSELNGYVGTKPAVREEGGNPQSLRQNTNLASPDPALANAAFTQSQFTSNISAAAIQSAEIRAQTTSGGGNEAAPTPDELRRANLKRYMQNNGGGRGGGGYSPYPNFPRRNPGDGQQIRPINNRGNQESSQLSNVSSLGGGGTTNTDVRDDAPRTGGAGSSFIAYTLSDPGFMYKTFSGTSGWFRVAQLIQPDGKRAKKVYASTMLVPDEGEDEAADDNQTTYSLRLVDTSTTPSKTLWADYDCTNTDNFTVHTMDLSSATTASGALLEIQGQNSGGHPVLVSSIIMEF